MVKLYGNAYLMSDKDMHDRDLFADLLVEYWMGKLKPFKDAYEEAKKRKKGVPDKSDSVIRYEHIASRGRSAFIEKG